MKVSFINNIKNNNLITTKNLFYFFIYLTIIWVVIWMLSCKSKSNELPVITPKNLIQNELSLKDIAEDVRYIKLDNAVLLSEIKDLKKTEDGYFIKTLDELYYFDNDGKFKYQIGKKGNGPKEYNRLYDFTLDNKSKLIYLLDFKVVKVFSFSGEYIYSFNTPDIFTYYNIYFFNNFLCFPKGFELGGLNTEWIITNKEGSIIRKKKNFITGIEPWVQYRTSLLFDDDNKLYYWNQINDTIFNIGENIEPSYLFANNNLRVTGEDLANEDNYRNKTSWQLISVLGTKSFLIFDYLLLKDKKEIYTFFDKDKQKMYEWSVLENYETKGVNNFDNGPVFIPKSKANLGSSEYLINFVDAYKFKALVNTNEFKISTPKYPEKKKQLEQLVNNLDENDNPVLMLVKLKE